MKARTRVDTQNGDTLTKKEQSRAKHAVEKCKNPKKRINDVFLASKSSRQSQKVAKTKSKKKRKKERKIVPQNDQFIQLNRRTDDQGGRSWIFR